MTEKQENILVAALRLFALQGFEGTSTNQIAKEAQVSEGLIFKHFENKEGLLNALMEEGKKRITKYIDLILKEQDAKKQIEAIIDLSVKLLEEEKEFWSLQFTLKYSNQHYAKLKKQSDYMQTIYVACNNAFSKLGYENPEKETTVLLLLIEGLSSAILTQGGDMDIVSTIQFIKAKYNL